MHSAAREQRVQARPMRDTQERRQSPQHEPGKTVPSPPLRPSKLASARPHREPNKPAPAARTERSRPVQPLRRQPEPAQRQAVSRPSPEYMRPAQLDTVRALAPLERPSRQAPAAQPPMRPRLTE